MRERLESRAAVYKKWASQHKLECSRPHLLSIKINRVPCKPCVEAMLGLLTTNRFLAIRIKASALTEDGKKGLRYLRATRFVMGSRIHFRAYAPAELAKRFGQDITASNINRLKNYKGKDPAPNVDWAKVKTPDEIKDQVKNTTSLKRYHKGWVREHYWITRDLAEMANAFEVAPEVLSLPWRKRNLSKEEILGVMIAVDILGKAASEGRKDWSLRQYDLDDDFPDAVFGEQRK